MKRSFLATLLILMLAVPSLYAETVIVLQEVVEIGFIGGDSPLDDPDTEGNTPPRPNDFRATIDGHSLRVIKQNANIPSAQVAVVNASNGGLVLNQLMTDSMEETISNNGVYVLHIETEGGALVGQFIVQ